MSSICSGFLESSQASLYDRTKRKLEHSEGSVPRGDLERTHTRFTCHLAYINGADRRHSTQVDAGCVTTFTCVTETVKLVLHDRIMLVHNTPIEPEFVQALQMLRHLCHLFRISAGMGSSHPIPNCLSSLRSSLAVKTVGARPPSGSYTPAVSEISLLLVHSSSGNS